MSKSKSYASDAKDYAKNSLNQFQWAPERIQKLKFRRNEALLDNGCDGGKITAEITKCLPEGRIVDIDSSAQMIILAQNTFPKQEYPNFSFSSYRFQDHVASLH
jgi:trans-aconitate methyltransferase